MKKGLAVAGLVTLAVSVALLAGPVRDWKDLHAVHEKVQSAIHDLERARAANHYDMAGHGAKAEELLRQAERELHEAVAAARAGK
jgi:hypothetical protein